jgi:hypothetical protein
MATGSRQANIMALSGSRCAPLTGPEKRRLRSASMRTPCVIAAWEDMSRLSCEAKATARPSHALSQTASQSWNITRCSAGQ